MTLPIFSFVLIIPYIVHIHRYVTHWKVSTEIQKKQWNIPLVLLGMLDWYIIYLITFKKSESALLLGVISGMISWYFVYDASKRVKMPPTKKLYTEFIDTVMILSLLVMSYNTKDPRVLFFVISDLVYHILEQVLPIKNTIV
jgi:hypothetical protein